MSNPTQSELHKFSLQKRLMMNTLITSVISGILSLFIVIGVIGYDTHELFDDVLEENAKLLLQGQNIADHQMKYHLDEYNEELELDYQMMNAQGIIVHKSPHAPIHPLITNSRDDQFYNIRYQNQWWRVYVAVQPNSQMQVQIAQPWEQRYEHLLPAIGHFIWLMLLLWILLLLGTWLSIRRGIKALNQIGEQISKKNVQDLSPVVPIEVMTEMQPVVDSINRLLQHLQQAIAAEQQFTADAAHELRTPLAAIQMKLQLLQRKHQLFLQPIQPELEQLKADVKRSTAVVENLLLLARLDPQQSYSLPKTTFSVMELLNELQRDIEPAIKSKQMQWLVEWHIHTEHALTANKELCFTALRNVLDNAVRYSYASGKILFKVELDAHYYYFIVQDEGIGVDVMQQQQLTQRFYRILGTEQQGSGLGLSIVQRIVDLHQGELSFISGLTPVQGLGVCIKLPR
ncbi:hypothetical protein F4V57_11090 [Acinetobacter qingfengensis]|uniref:histidine kinase n=1 Tax=Acinetobacter qingfengensis TaxID=1262585 RepID=A0A1E7RCZ5_9GAMM|nr:ATP-binding protein [Acinetobacter qingfengensis]KAA8732154.1 hypothetical protein F4V57_11090 [Acinetobacter qingfengensis]OEY97234.1 hypothetical protein BJI46_02075 [Acinetobacter qingfengensis]